jgi:hypothetical protein
MMDCRRQGTMLAVMFMILKPARQIGLFRWRGHMHYAGRYASLACGWYCYSPK